MIQQNKLRNLVLILVSLILLLIAWKTLSGALGQWSISVSAGQQLETVIQFICGVLSIVVLIGIWVRLPYVTYIQYAWGLSLVITSVVSALVWGPPMWLPTIAFGLLSGGIVYGVLRIIRKHSFTND